MASITRAAASLAASTAVLLSLAATAQTSPDVDSARPASRTGTQPSSASGAQQSTPPSPAAQPAYPSSDLPPGTTPSQRQRQGPTATSESEMVCNQEDELAHSECLRRDMTDDDDRPAGVTSSMHERRKQAEREKESMNVASEADTGSDQARGRSRTRTASSDLPGVQDTEQQGSEADEAQAPATEANNASDTLGRER